MSSQPVTAPVERCAGEGHRAVGAGEARRALELGVATLSRLARPSASVFYQVGPDREPCGFELFGLAEPMHRSYLERYCRIDPQHPARLTSPADRVLMLDRALPRPLRERSAYWSSFLSRYDVVDVMEVWLRKGEGVVGAFSLLRMAPDEPFSPREIESVEAVQPLLEAALMPRWQSALAPRPLPAGSKPLTHREQQIARLVRTGLSNKEIGRSLALEPTTVKTHLLRIFRKAGVSSRTELIAALFLGGSADAALAGGRVAGLE
ncbi:helix-turn-helix transcriptional regulator [Trinickia caryophylli]|uniref:Regulatory protein, luxR family n=1 Tax=Trinickia caryophylli TaxID=28094 RepID=A0A1X7CIZ9_TRICW|nr:helix-turn-helix transcriptional regulator [Trinickia caryophylli]PMS11505.1 LuxR family transcriptional regulator [Trinickia caryophylli]TRX19944.1 helix-turn-helix transcriptional regulator [Trinickia caryophylli]WQE12719.1 helix-turn-helix transcriptional regulator [Trinickia caryophylli]SME97477.1 regulatory protein, luxR family [Trinickia caryophylli]GLU30426.1 helix-turn-helix transcriptional regulator [Trinickia caryophylli]